MTALPGFDSTNPIAMANLCFVTTCMGRLHALRQSLGAFVGQGGSCSVVDYSPLISPSPSHSQNRPPLPPPLLRAVGSEPLFTPVRPVHHPPNRSRRPTRHGTPASRNKAQQLSPTGQPTEPRPTPSFPSLASVQKLIPHPAPPCIQLKRARPPTAPVVTSAISRLRPPCASPTRSDHLTPAPAPAHTLQKEIHLANSPRLGLVTVPAQA